MTDLELMGKALEEASQSTRAVRPNPKVGCALLTPSGQVISAHHLKCGDAHAEAWVLQKCTAQGIDPRGSTVAVTLEPCSHFGRTPPCADALIAAGVSRVLVATEDPNPLVSGNGIQKLRTAGISVELGVFREEAEALNHEWLQSHRQKRPFVTVKMATSLDGLWTAADGESQWITSATARAQGHLLRARVDAVVTGRKTFEKDHPSFTARPEMWLAATESMVPPRDWRGEQPEVIVLSRKTTPDLKVFLQGLYMRGIHDVMVEAGPTLTHAFLESGCVNEIWIFQGTRFLGGNGLRLAALAGGTLPGLQVALIQAKTFQEGDLFLRYRLKNSRH